MQLSTVLKGDPTGMVTLLNTLAAGNTIQLLKKANSAGSFIVVYDDVAGIGQEAFVFRGDPRDIANRLNEMIGDGYTIQVVEPTHSAAYYLVVASL